MTPPHADRRRDPPSPEAGPSRPEGPVAALAGERLARITEHLARTLQGARQATDGRLRRAIRVLAEELDYQRVILLRFDREDRILSPPILSWSPDRGRRDRITRAARSVDDAPSGPLAEAFRSPRPIRIEAPPGGGSPGADSLLALLLETRPAVILPLAGPDDSPRGRGLLVVAPAHIVSATGREDPEMDGLRVVAAQLGLGLDGLERADELRRTRQEYRQQLAEARGELRESLHRLFRYERREFHLDLIAGLAHDLKNPLLASRQFARLLDLDTQRILERLDRIGERELHDYAQQVRRIASKVQQACAQVQDSLQSLEQRIVASAGVIETDAQIDAARLLTECLDEIPGRSRPGLVIHREIEPSITIQAHPDGLRSLYMNIIVNAIESLPEDGGGEVWVKLHRIGAAIVFVVEDSGRGIEAAAREAIFTARYTTKQRGTGLGLAWVKRNVTQHLGGQIEVESGDLGGGVRTRFTVTIPVQRREASDEAARTDRG